MNKLGMAENQTEICGITSEEIIRPQAILDCETFTALVSINSKRRWLLRKTEALHEILSTCDQKGQAKLVLELVERFECISSGELEELTNNISHFIVNEWKLKPSSCRIVATSDSFKSDGSQAALWNMKRALAEFPGWQEEHLINNIKDGVKSTQSGWSIVLFEDFIGSGKTIKRRIDWVKNEFLKAQKKDINIKVCALAAMQASEEILNESGHPYHIGIWLKKGISDYYSGSDLYIAKNHMESLEKKLSPIVKGLRIQSHSFGFGRSEALYCQESGNAPNNVFPIFWWEESRDNKPRKVMFRRMR